MAQILVKAGEYLWSKEGTRIIDENGFAVKATEDTMCEVPDERYEFIISVVENDRKLQQQLIEEEQKYKQEQEKKEEAHTQPTQEEIEAMWLENATVSIKQAKLAFLELDLLEKIEEEIEKIDDIKLKKKIQIKWEYDYVFQKKSDLAQFIFEKLNMSKEEIDNFFLMARNII